MITPISSPSEFSSSTISPKCFSVRFISTIIIILKYPCTIVWEISRILMLFCARYVHTFAIMPTVSFPTTVIIVFFIVNPFLSAGTCPKNSPAICKTMYRFTNPHHSCNLNHFGNFAPLCHPYREVPGLISVIRHGNLHPYRLISQFRQVIVLA